MYIVILAHFVQIKRQWQLLICHKQYRFKCMRMVKTVKLIEFKPNGKTSFNILTLIRILITILISYTKFQTLSIWKRLYIQTLLFVIYDIKHNNTHIYGNVIFNKKIRFCCVYRS